MKGSTGGIAHQQIEVGDKTLHLQNGIEFIQHKESTFPVACVELQAGSSPIRISSRRRGRRRAVDCARKRLVRVEVSGYASCSGFGQRPGKNEHCNCADADEPTSEINCRFHVALCLRFEKMYPRLLFTGERFRESEHIAFGFRVYPQKRG